MWLEWRSEEEATDKDEKERIRIRRLTEDRVEPDMPEALELLYRLRTWNTLYWEGGLADQPCLLMEELEACIHAENSFKAKQLKNLAAQAAFLEKQAENNG